MRDDIPALFQRALAHDGAPLEAELTALVRGFARVRREGGAPPERVVVELKQCMGDRPLDLLERIPAHELQQRMVSACIREYYATGAGTTPATAAAPPLASKDAPA